MAKMLFYKKSRKEFTCRVCGKLIPVGSAYKLTEPRASGIIRAHMDCRIPITMTSSSKMAGIYETIATMERDNFANVADDLRDLAEEVRNVGEEYQEAADNQREYFPDSEIAQENEEKAEQLDQWADELEEKSNEAEELADELEDITDENERVDKENEILDLLSIIDECPV